MREAQNPKLLLEESNKSVVCPEVEEEGLLEVVEGLEGLLEVEEGLEGFPEVEEGFPDVEEGVVEVEAGVEEVEDGLPEELELEEEVPEVEAGVLEEEEVDGGVPETEEVLEDVWGEHSDSSRMKSHPATKVLFPEIPTTLWCQGW